MYQSRAWVRAVGRRAGGRRVPLIIAAMAVLLPFVVSVEPTAAAVGCGTGNLAPVLRDVTISQGLNTYARLARG